MVAGEVKQLAERSRSITQGIRDLIDTIQHEGNEAKAVCERGFSTFEHGSAASAEACALLETIGADVRRIAEHMARIEGVANQQMDASEAIIVAVDGFSSGAAGLKETVQAEREHLASAASGVRIPIHS
ncbi:Methyl-accepting chemotaxis protein (MCP) signaling domain protein [compost metagenome]